MPVRDRQRADIIEVTARLLRTAGEDAVTTRGVAAEAGVQAPVIYRLFGDKDGLLDAVAEQVFATYVGAKTSTLDEGEPLAALRAGWDTHIGFGLANPALFAFVADPRRGARSPSAAAGLAVLRARVHRVAAAGRLRVAEERAVDLIHAAGTGAVLAILGKPPEQRDLALADTAYEAVLRTILTGSPAAAPDGSTAAAVALRSGLADLDVLSAAETALLAEWLDRIIAR